MLFFMLNSVIISEGSHKRPKGKLVVGSNGIDLHYPHIFSLTQVWKMNLLIGSVSVACIMFPHECLYFVSQRMQLDIILTSLQDHTHVASLLGYSSPADGPEVLSSGPAFTALPEPAYGTTTGHPDTHLAEILMKTLLRNLGFYTVS